MASLSDLPTKRATFVGRRRGAALLIRQLEAFWTLPGNLTCMTAANVEAAAAAARTQQQRGPEQLVLEAAAFSQGERKKATDEAMRWRTLVLSVTHLDSRRPQCQIK